MKQWLNMLLDEAKASLVTCSPTEFARLQGEAQAYKRMLDQMVRAPLNVPVERGPTI